MRILTFILGAVAIITTALPLSRHPAWWIRVLDFPRLQIFILGTLALIGYWIFTPATDALSLLFTVLVLLSLGYQAYMIYPYTRLVSPQTERCRHPDPDNTVAILFANVLQDNRDAEGLRKIIRSNEADLVLLVETDDWWLDQVREALNDYPHQVLHPLDNTYGMVLFSRLELIEPKVEYLIEEGVPSIRGRARLRSGRVIEIRCLHPPPPIPKLADTSEPRDAELIMVGKENREDETPFIVFGDLNDVAWSRNNYLFQNISGLLDPRVGRGFYHTFHAKIPFLRFPLDHLFHSNHFRLVEFRRLGYFGSDHFPVYVKLCWEDDARVAQEELEPTPDEVEEAAEKAAYAEDAPPVEDPPFIQVKPAN
jgi:endonuclease/exonuclease/phosphatase (EEP) superfamily protein YafD